MDIFQFSRSWELHPSQLTAGIHGLFMKWNALVYGPALVNHPHENVGTILIYWSPFITCKLWRFSKFMGGAFVMILWWFCCTTQWVKLFTFPHPTRFNHADKVSHQRFSRYIGTCHVHLNRTPGWCQKRRIFTTSSGKASGEVAPSCKCCRTSGDSTMRSSIRRFSWTRGSAKRRDDLEMTGGLALREGTKTSYHYSTTLLPHTS